MKLDCVGITWERKVEKEKRENRLVKVLPTHLLNRPDLD